MLKTCNKIDIPPNPSKNAQTITFIDIAFILIVDTMETPFVSSTIPESIPFANCAGIWNIESTGESVLDSASKVPVLFKIDIITLKSITNPPIITIVLTEFIILFCKIPPRELNSGGVFLLILYAALFDLGEELYFQNLNKIPTVKDERRCVANSKSPNSSISKKRNTGLFP